MKDLREASYILGAYGYFAIEIVALCDCLNRRILNAF